MYAVGQPAHRRKSASDPRDPEAYPPAEDGAVIQKPILSLPGRIQRRPACTLYQTRPQSEPDRNPSELCSGGRYGTGKRRDLVPKTI